MKLRNKKTGKIYTARSMWFNDSIDDLEKTTWKTLKEFCEDWEDVEEPLIKDEKIRKAVRAWSNSVGCMGRIIYESNFNRFVAGYGSDISFDVPLGFGDGHYTIDELCGGEEE